MQQVGDTVQQRTCDAHLRRVCQSFARRLTDAGIGVRSSCAKSETRNSSTSQPNCSSCAVTAPCRRRGHGAARAVRLAGRGIDRKSTRLNSSHPSISYAVFCLKKKKKTKKLIPQI